MKGELIVLFKSPRELSEDRRAIFNKFDDRWAAILRDDGVANEALATAGTVTGIEYRKAQLETLVKIRDLIGSFNSDYAAHTRLAKRSERFRRQLSGSH